MNLFVIVLIAATLGATVFGLLYRYFVQPVVLQHFGEEYRRDFEARKRRRAFEANVGAALTCVYFSSVARAVFGSLQQLPQGVFWGIAGLLFLSAGGFAYAAFQRWHDPFTD